MSDDYNTNYNKKTMTIAILSLIVAFLTLLLTAIHFIYTVYNDNAEIISIGYVECESVVIFPELAPDEYHNFCHCIVTNASQRNVSIVNAYVTYDSVKISTGLEYQIELPIMLVAGESKRIPFPIPNTSYYIEPTLIKIHIFTSDGNEYVSDV